MPGLVEEMGVDIERDCHARMAEDPADLYDVEREVDDQVAGKAVAQVVEAKRRPPVSGLSDGGACAPMMRAECVGVRRRGVRYRDCGCGGEAS